MPSDLIDELFPERPVARRPEIVPLSQAVAARLAALGDDTIWTRHLEEHQAGLRWSLIAMIEGRSVGYGSLRWPISAVDHPPEITDLLVLEDSRRRGVGSALILELASWAATGGHSRLLIRLGVSAAFGQANRLAARCGFQPDGQGVTIEGQPVQPDSMVRLDDRMVLIWEKMLGE